MGNPERTRRTGAMGIALLTAVLSACGSSDSPPAPTSAAAPAAAPETTAPNNYTPTPVYCADPSVSTLCPVVPSFIGADPDLLSGDGYQGLSNDVTSASNDAQSPFDNMAWQMFVALNWQASNPTDPASGLNGAGPVVWQGYATPEAVFDGPVGNCPNPNNLPRFNIIAKAGTNPRDQEFLQATGQPLIDANGNWTLFERRMNSVEQQYIESQGLNTYEGQQKFIEAGNSVLFQPGQQVPTNGVVGAIEIKASWKIIGEADKASYFHTQGLIDVQGAYVSDGQPLCAEVTLGLVGLHIIQANSEVIDPKTKLPGALQPKFIWASFEHKNNAPTSSQACDAVVDNTCYQTIANNNCPAPSDAGSYAYYNPTCSALPVNTPPAKKPGESAYVWSRTQPYAAAYLTPSNNAQCGTQVSRCWQVYDLTADLNTAWTAQLAAINSVFANYYLIGTNWGANIEPVPGKLDNGSVPAFLGNSTMETYIQTDPQFGNCVNCHAGAQLAYSSTDANGKPVHYSANFSFLLGLATQQSCQDLPAGPLFNQQDAEATCPKVCSAAEDDWNGQWTTTVFGKMSVCGCCG